MLLALMALVALGVNRCLAPPAGPADSRALSLTLTHEDLSAVDPSADFRSSLPPIDLGQAERMAQGATLGRLALPDSRAVQTWREAKTGEEITSAVLLYDDPAGAATLAEMAAPLLGSAFGLQVEPLEMAGVDDAQRLVSAQYQAISLRREGLLVLVGTSRADDPERILRLAERALARVDAWLASRTESPVESLDDRP
jgi:hypothetical protein